MENSFRYTLRPSFVEFTGFFLSYIILFLVGILLIYSNIFWTGPEGHPYVFGVLLGILFMGMSTYFIWNRLKLGIFLKLTNKEITFGEKKYSISDYKEIAVTIENKGSFNQRRRNKYVVLQGNNGGHKTINATLFSKKGLEEFMKQDPITNLTNNDSSQSIETKVVVDKGEDMCNDKFKKMMLSNVIKLGYVWLGLLIYIEPITNSFLPGGNLYLDWVSFRTGNDLRFALSDLVLILVLTYGLWLTHSLLNISFFERVVTRTRKQEFAEIALIVFAVGFIMFSMNLLTN